MNLTLPGFSDMELWELRRTIADLTFQRDVVQGFLERAEAELRHRRQERREGVVRMFEGIPSKPNPGNGPH